MQNARQRSRESKAVGQHVLVAGHAELAAEEVIPIKDLTEDRFGVRRVYVAFFHRGAGREPASCSYILLQLLESLRIVLLHQAIAVRAGEVKNVVRIRVRKVEVIP